MVKQELYRESEQGLINIESQYPNIQVKETKWGDNYEIKDNDTGEILYILLPGRSIESNRPLLSNEDPETKLWTYIDFENEDLEITGGHTEKAPYLLNLANAGLKMMKAYQTLMAEDPTGAYRHTQLQIEKPIFIEKEKRCLNLTLKLINKHINSI